MIIGDRFQLNNKINSGSFGEIHLAVDLKTKQTVAVKNGAPRLQTPSTLILSQAPRILD
jgi:serine/threonine protein kinase